MGVPRFFRGTSRAWGFGRLMTLSNTQESRFVLGSLHTTASHTIGVPHLVELLRVVPSDAPHERYREAVVDDNVLGRPTQAGRQRTFRHLRELYFLDPAQREYAALRRLWDVDPEARPLLAGILAFTRDGILRASFSAIKEAPVGTIVSSADLTKAVAAVYGGGLSNATLGKTGRNTGACWTQTGHLVGRSKKIRHRGRSQADCYCLRRLPGLPIRQQGRWGPRHPLGRVARSCCGGDTRRSAFRPYPGPG